MFTILDFETTGLDYKEEQVIEIGAVKLDKFFKPVSQLNVFVKLAKGKELDPFITRLTGITPEDLENGIETQYAALTMLQRFIGNDIVVAQFASFDLSFLSPIMKPKMFICTRSVSRMLDKDKKAGLKDLVPRYGASLENHHRAIDDALATADVFKAMMARLPMNGYVLDHVLNVMVDSKERPLKYVPDNAQTIYLEGN
ncbi:3'-5' exonuclease [Priestia megaterium]|uniref:3'-5' exonuclease n=1 Tax=Priestia megaterium TaxID=1404 RepID=UPI000BF79990|nr:3'-5' exonuclease [Priestia megaterium]PFW43758.1 DNA polymerase III subunit epsilon [Priestia megaterium]